PSRRVIFLEDHIEVIAHLLPTQLGTELLHDSQAQLIYFADLNDPVFHELTWKFIHREIAVVAIPAYENTSEELKHKIYHDSTHKNITINEYLDGGRGYYLNFYRNLSLLPQSYWGNALFKQFEGIPAILCGAGPSLQKQLPLLHQLKDHALIFG